MPPRCDTMATMQLGSRHSSETFISPDSREHSCPYTSARDGREAAVESADGGEGWQRSSVTNGLRLCQYQEGTHCGRSYSLIYYRDASTL